ncbi:MAG: 4-hydroxy-3-methylbut-2-enyl diphosphate reductase [Planctomycetota bacterium]
MRIILAGPRGFCAGVNMAIESLDLAIQTFGPPIYVFHEIVHNRHVVESFCEKGALFVESLETVPGGAIVLFSAHGVSPALRRQAARRGIKAIDATCPLVTKVHLEARRFARDGYAIVLIGHRGHDEVVGALGEAPEAMHLVETVADVDQLDLPVDARVAYLTQTTLSVHDAEEIIDRLRQRFAHLTARPRHDICYATQNRQQAVRVLAAEADVVLVVGSQNSSNSRRLQEIAAACGVAAYLIDGPEDIRGAWFHAAKTVLVTAGASAPESIVKRCIDYLREQFQARVETRSLHDERTRFPLPEPLRAAARDGARPDRPSPCP